MFRLAPLALAALVAGCTAPSDSTLPYPMPLTAEGIGPLHPGDPFDPKILSAKLPGFDLIKASRITPQHPETVLILKRGKAPVAYLFADPSGTSVAQISVVSAQIKDPRGQGVSDPIRRSADLHCAHESCRYGSEENLIYTLDPGSGTIREITVQKL